MNWVYSFRKKHHKTLKTFCLRKIVKFLTYFFPCRSPKTWPKLKSIKCKIVQSEKCNLFIPKKSVNSLQYFDIIITNNKYKKFLCGVFCSCAGGTLFSLYYLPSVQVHNWMFEVQKPQTESCASCLTFQLFQLGSTTSCSVLTSSNKDKTGLSALACWLTWPFLLYVCDENCKVLLVLTRIRVS